MKTTTPKPSWASDYPSYQDIVESWGVETLLWEDIGDYQGDYVVLVRKAGAYGFVMIGYGSCSGCDSLEAETPYGDDADWTGIVELAESLREGVHWEATAQGMIDWLGTRSELNSWYMNDTKMKAALDLIKDMLRILAAA